MAKIKCECHNYGECDIADNHEQIEVESTEMECPECHKPLYPIEDKTIPWWKTHKKQLMLGGGVLAVLAIVAGILFGTGIIGGQKVPPTITLSESNITLKVGERTQLKASMEPERKNATFTFKSSDPECVEVTDDGVIKALSKTKGATITVKLEDAPSVTAYCKVTVEEDTGATPIRLVETISINEPSATLKVGEKKTFTYNALPQDHVENITWTSSDESVAKVDTQTGEVTAVKAGTATIIVQTDTSGKTTSIIVTVEQSETVKKRQNDEKKPQPTTGTISLSYGKYTGAIKNGYPNGQGKLVYTTPRQINKYDTKGRMAQPGDYVQGVFVNGFFTIGKHYNSAGELIESINVGVADDVYESK